MASGTPLKELYFDIASTLHFCSTFRVLVLVRAVEIQSFDTRAVSQYPLISGLVSSCHQ